MKSQEQRIQDATAAFLGYTKDWYRGNFDSNKVSEHHWRAAIADALEAADRPAWPSDESVAAFLGDATGCEAPAGGDDQRENLRGSLREAMLADPVIKAAVALRDWIGHRETQAEARALFDAINEAGL